MPMKPGILTPGGVVTLHRQVCLDRPVLKLRVFEKGENAILRFSGQKNSFATLIFDRLGLPAGEDETTGVGQCEALECLGGRVCIADLLRICSQDCREDYEQCSESTKPGAYLVVIKDHLVRRRR